MTTFIYFFFVRFLNVLSWAEMQGYLNSFKKRSTQLSIKCFHERIQADISRSLKDYMTSDQKLLIEIAHI